MTRGNTICWGIIGVGDVCEVKSGPGFYRNADSRLLAVMRRNGDKARDYAQRHNVPQWYDNADAILQHPDINAVYIATPPAQHKDYAIAAMNAGKDVYIEKPVTLNAAECAELMKVAQRTQRKVCVAHYRRTLPHFVKMRELIQSGAIGTPQLAMIDFLRCAPSNTGADNWRLNPALSGGGLFHDLAPHQLDLMLYWFGPAQRAQGMALNQRQIGGVDDCVQGWAQLASGVMLQGRWHFAVDDPHQRDHGEIIGTQGRINFNFFRDGNFTLTTAHGTEHISIDYPPHVQQPLIARINAYFRGEGDNPSSLEDAWHSMSLMDCFTQGPV